MKSLYRKNSQVTQDIRKIRWPRGAPRLRFFVGLRVALAAASAPPPRLKPAQEILPGVLPKSCGDLVPDGEGNLWCLDILQKKVVKITSAGKWEAH